MRLEISVSNPSGREEPDGIRNTFGTYKQCYTLQISDCSMTRCSFYLLLEIRI